MIALHETQRRPPIDTKPVVAAAKPVEFPVRPKIDFSEVQYRKIFVGGLPHNLALKEFREYFDKYGVLEDCVILKDKRTQKPRGFGFVTYTNIQSVHRIMKDRQNHYIQGKWVDCKSAVPISEMKSLNLNLSDDEEDEDAERVFERIGEDNNELKEAKANIKAQLREVEGNSIPIPMQARPAPTLTHELPNQYLRSQLSING